MKTTFLTATVLALGASYAMADNVNPGVFFGDGNGTGSFVVNRAQNVEIGLRAKLRYNSNGDPENTFNWDGSSTYTFDPRNSDNPINRSVFNFEFAINTDVFNMDNDGNNLNDFAYLLTVSRMNDNGMGTTDLFSFDPINVDYADHEIGDNGTVAGTDFKAPLGDTVAYAQLISDYNVAQQSWNLGFFNSQPTRAGTYFINLTAFTDSSMDTVVTSTDITVNVVPVPTAAFAGLGLLGSLAGFRAIRRR